MKGPQRFPAFRRAVRWAVAAAAGKRPFGRMLETAATLLGRHPSALRRVARDAAALLRMARETLSGHYRKAPRRSLIAAVAALFYLVDPLDLIPDAIPVLGLLDDAVVLTWVARQVRHDVDAFLDWEREFGGAIDVEAESVGLDDAPASLSVGRAGT